MNKFSITMAVINAIKGALAQKPGEGSLMALEYMQHYQKFNGSVSNMSQAQINQEFSHLEMRKYSEGLSFDELILQLQASDPKLEEITKELMENTEEIFSEEDQLSQSVISSEYFQNEPPFIEYIKSYKESLEIFKGYVSKKEVPAYTTFKLLNDKYCLLYEVLKRLLTLTNELKITNHKKVTEIEIRDKSENALETVTNYYKEQYEYSSKRLKEFSEE